VSNNIRRIRTFDLMLVLWTIHAASICIDITNTINRESDTFIVRRSLCIAICLICQPFAYSSVTNMPQTA